MPPFPFLLAAIDLDDTLLDPDKRISPENLAAVRRLRSAGCRVVLASGRRHERMADFYDALGLDDFAISCQGARVQRMRTGEVLVRAELSAKASAEVIARGEAEGFTAVVWRSQGIYAARGGAWTERYRSETGGDVLRVERDAAVSPEPAEKVVWVGEPAALRRAAASAAPTWGGTAVLTEAHAWCLEWAHPSANKGTALAALAGHLGILREAVLAFGDGYNDVSMLSWAGLGIAMAHGRESARAAAKRLTPPGDPATAFARAVEELVS